jgi:hypothetical protein
MKKTQLLFASFSILVCLIVLPVIRSVNTLPSNPPVPPPSLISDGNPLPAPIPNASHAVVLAADGNPLPAPIPC